MAGLLIAVALPYSLASTTSPTPWRLSVGPPSSSNGGCLDLTWDVSDPSAVAAFRVYRSNSAEGPFGLVFSDSVDTMLGRMEYVDTGLTDGASYYYRVVLVKKDGSLSSFSNTAEGTVPVGPRSGAAIYPGKHIIISIADERIYFLENDILVRSHLCSTGRPEMPTPCGVFYVMYHNYCEVSYQFGGVYCYWWMGFLPGYGMHALPYNPYTGTWTSASCLGTRASHGCVRQGIADSEWAYNWAPNGTRIDIIPDHWTYVPPPPPPLTGGTDVVGASGPARAFYFAEGTCRPNFTPYFCIQNPGSKTADVQITYMKGDGTTDSQTLSVPAASRVTVAAKDKLGEGDNAAHDFSSVVECTNGQKIIAERPMYFIYNGWSGGSVVVGATSLSTRYYFAEGTTRPGFDPYFCLLNPGNTTARVMLYYIRGNGTTTTQSCSVAPRSRWTVHPADVLGTGDDRAYDFSCRVVSTNGVGIVAERPMYFAYKGAWTGGTDVIGAVTPAAEWYFAEGTARPSFDPYLTVLNPGDKPAQINITYMKGDGTTKYQIATVPPDSRGTIHPPDALGIGDDTAHDFSCKVVSSNGEDVVVERPMYFDLNGCDGGTDVVGASGPARAFYFAEGTCRPNFTPYFCIQNPGSKTADVQITYMKGDGTTDSQTLSVPAASRVTVAAKDKLGEGDNAAHDFSSVVECTNGQKIIAERPMYFSIPQ